MGMNEFLSDEHGQISAELIIVLAAVIAVAVVLVTQLQNTASNGSSKVNDTTEKALQKIDDLAK